MGGEEQPPQIAGAKGLNEVELFNRGARIRTGDLTDPNGARYQAAPRPDAQPVSHKPPIASPQRPALALALPTKPDLTLSV